MIEEDEASLQDKTWKTVRGQGGGSPCRQDLPSLRGKVYLLFTSPPFLMNLYNYAWFVGFFVAFFAYGGFMTVVSKIKPATSW